MPCRIHQQNDIAAATAKRVNVEWATVTKEAVESTDVIAGSPIGYASSLLFPECLPQRLETITSLIQLGGHYDGIS